MKRSIGKQFLKNKWVVPVSAIILTLCIGAFAFASPGGPDPSSSASAGSTTTTAAPYTTVTQPGGVPSSVVPGPTGVSYPIFSFLGDGSELELGKVKENAILDLIGAKMVPEDKATFDRLRATAEEQQLLLSQALANLQATKTEISALIDEYLAVPNGLTPSMGSEAVTSQTTTSSQVPQ